MSTEGEAPLNSIAGVPMYVAFTLQASLLGLDHELASSVHSNWNGGRNIYFFRAATTHRIMLL